MAEINEDMAEIIYVHILEQTLIDDTIMVSNKELAETYKIPEEDVETIIDGLIDNRHLLKIRDGCYTVKFDNLEQIK